MGFKKIGLAIICIVWTVLASLPAYSSDTVLGVDPKLIDAAVAGEEMLFRRKYDEALEWFDKISKDFPDSATGLFGKMAIWQLKMFENEDFRFKSQYNVAEQQYEKFAMNQLRKGDVPSWELFVHGAADGMRGFFKGREGKWVQALSHGLHAMRMFKMLKWQAPDFVDTDLGTGMYKYWRSAFTSELKFLPFFGDYRAEGIDMVKRVVLEGKYAKDLASASLVFMYNYEKKYDDAIRIADSVLATYPENIILRYLKGDIAVEKKDYAGALEVFRKIYEMDPSINIALLQQGKILYKMKDYSGSKEALEKYLTTNCEKQWCSVAHLWLGLVAETSGDKAAAISQYEKSLELYKTKQAKERLARLAK